MRVNRPEPARCDGAAALHARRGPTVHSVRPLARVIVSLTEDPRARATMARSRRDILFERGDIVVHGERGQQDEDEVGG